MNSKFILLVEDNPDDELLVVRALRKNRIWNDVEVVHDGVAALDFLFATGPCCGRDPGELPAVVLLDLRLPRMHGFQVLRRIRADQRTQDLPVIIITASWEVEDILSGFSLRADGYVCKTASFDKFVNALGHLGLGGLLADEPSPAKVKALRKAHLESSGEETSEPIHLGLND
ncbi:MAG: two-component system response regulator [Verrucomicrobia bacterium]|nr:MAG: two-component system response regulator [Verrucomicrobiota bacterium]